MTPADSSALAYVSAMRHGKKRVADCQCQFKDLERHMQTQHPKFDPDKGADALAGKA